MLQVAGLVGRCDNEAQAVILAIAVLLRPEFLDRSDERATAATIADQVGYGIRRAAELVDSSASTDDLTPKFWDELFKQVLATLDDYVVMGGVEGSWTAEDCAIYLSLVLARKVTAQEWQDYANGFNAAPESFLGDDHTPLWDAEQVTEWDPQERERFAKRRC